MKSHSPLKYYYFLLFLSSAYFVFNYSYAIGLLIFLAVICFSYYLVISNQNQNFISGAFYKNLAISIFLSLLYAVVLLTVTVKIIIFPTLLLNTLQVFGILITILMLPVTLYYMFHKMS